MSISRSEELLAIDINAALNNLNAARRGRSLSSVSFTSITAGSGAVSIKSILESLTENTIDYASSFLPPSDTGDYIVASVGTLLGQVEQDLEEGLRCASGCSSTCGSTCSGSSCTRSCSGSSCSYNCSRSCGASCTSNCGGDCDNACGYNCQDACTWFCGQMCWYSCAYYCTSCYDSWAWGCVANCGFGCSHVSCKSACGNMCIATCATGCQGGCDSYCTTGCGKSCTGCRGGCQPGCTGKCYTSGCQNACGSSCAVTCDTSCSSSCISGCSTSSRMGTLGYGSTGSRNLNSPQISLGETGSNTEQGYAYVEIDPNESVSTSIYYTTDGTTPTTSDNRYTTSFKLENLNEEELIITVMAINTASGFGDSNVSSLTITVPAKEKPILEKVKTPVITFDELTAEVAITCETENATIRYTLDSTIPIVETDGILYEGKFYLEKSGSIVATAFKEGMSPSDFARITCDKKIKEPIITFESDNGSTASFKAVTLTETKENEEELISYIYNIDTKDSNNYPVWPDAEIMVMSVEGRAEISSDDLIEIPYEASDREVNSIYILARIAANNWEASDSSQCKYDIPDKTANPVVECVDNKVTITCSTSSATIYYTTNGDNPSTGSTRYSDSFTISTTTTVKAIAVASGKLNSDVITEVCSFIPTEATPVTS